MKHKKFLLIALICLIGIGISFLLFSAHRPFKDLEAADITSASVRLSPPDTTIQIVETEELLTNTTILFLCQIRFTFLSMQPTKRLYQHIRKCYTLMRNKKQS